MITQTNQSEGEKTSKLKRIKIFNTIDLTKAKAKARTVEKSPRVLVMKKVKKSKSYVEQPITITENSVLDVKEGSVQKYIDECHPDIRKFIMDNKPATIVAKTEKLIVVTKNGLRIVVKTIGKFQRSVKITDKKKNILFNDITICSFKKVKDEGTK